MRELKLLNNNEAFKLGDTSLKLIFQAVDDGEVHDFSSDNSVQIKVKNSNEYLMSIDTEIDKQQVYFTTDKISSLPIGKYYLELWNVNGNTAIYPSDGFLQLEITANVNGDTGEIVPSQTQQMISELTNKVAELQKKVDA